MISPSLRYRILTGLRKAYFMSYERKQVLERCETATPAMKKDGTPKLRLGKQCYVRRYNCEVCGKGDFKAPKEFQVDHISPVGGTPGTRDTPKWWSWDIYINRLFCDADQMQGICTNCHICKTVKDKANIKNGTFYKDLAKVYLEGAEK